MTVVVADYELAAAEQVRAEIEEAGGTAAALSLDVTMAREVKAAVGEAAQRFGRIDVLANIAGGSFYTKRIEDFTWAEWKVVIDTNLKGTFLMCREVAPIMQKQKNGRILNTASNYGVTGCALRAFKRAALDGVFPFHGWHRFLPILVQGGGSTTKEVPVNHRPRVAGVSKYGVWDRFGRGIFDLIGVRWYQKRRLQRVPLTQLSD